jgi:uncharacterized membrane protein YozB (DUF420 family)
MSDEQTASTLTLVAAILQLLMSLGTIVLSLVMLLPILALVSDPFIWSIVGALLLLPIALGLVGFMFGFILAILWFNWRSNPSEHKTGLIASGVLALIFAGFIPGLLALIAGAIAPTPSAYIAPISQKPVVPGKGIRYCPACGQAIDDAYAQYCWRCGAPL